MPYTILYLEDETAIIELIQLALEHPDVKLLYAETPAEGMRILHESKPDLFLLDVMLPGRSGWSIYEELRADSAFCEMPIIVLTAQVHRYRIQKEFAASRIDAYITKPFDIGTVRNEIEVMLGAPLWSKSVQPKNTGV